ncbi:hypothetical protein P7M07_23270, partial [Vibrio parahaemolyticus]|nr:hypothetical protein [Vibrio parahaemolyticus]
LSCKTERRQCMFLFRCLRVDTGAAKYYFLRKAKAKQKPVEMSRSVSLPAVPLLNSNSEKVSEPSVETNSHYDSQNMDVEYTEVEVSSLEPHQENGRLP